MQPKAITLNFDDLDADGVCASQTPGGAGNLTINGALASGGTVTFTVPALVTLTTTGDETGITFTYTGTDRTGRTITETVTGVNASTVTTTKQFKTITQIAVSGAAAAAITVGNSNVAYSQWIPWNRFAANRSILADLNSTANFTWELEHTNNNVQADGFEEEDASVIADTDHTSETTDLLCPLESVYAATRFHLTSYVAGGLTAYVVEERAV